MKTFAFAAIAGMAAAGNIFDKIHDIVGEAEQLLDDA